MSFVRNPNFWDTTVIDGVEYQMPFADRLVVPIIVDVSTEIAALRTGKVDMMREVPITHWKDLETTNPELLSAKFANNVNSIVLQASEPPFDDVNVRRAMMIGTDIEGFRRLAFATEYPIHIWPAHPTNPGVYTPLEELPASIQLLYDYDPDLAIDMLAKADYPDGFDIDIYTVSDPESLDRCALLEAMWRKLNVRCTIKPFDSSTFTMHRHGDFHGVCVGRGDIQGSQISNPVRIAQTGKTGGFGNYGGWYNARVDEIAPLLDAEPDEAKRNELCKEVFLLMLDEVYGIPTNFEQQGHYWWPWVKNYYGEHSLSDGTAQDLLPYMWIDQDLKAEMGY